MEEHSSSEPQRQPDADSKGDAPLQKLFNKDSGGLRAGWRLLIFVLIFLALLIGSTFAVIQIFRPGRDIFAPGFQFAAESASLASAVAAAWIMSMIEGRSMGGYGLPANSAFGKLFWQGCLFGLVEIAALVGVIAAFRGYSFGPLAEHGMDILRWASFWGIFFLIVGFFEEFLFRGYALQTLTEGIGFWPAAVLLCLAFGAVHLQNPGENPVGAAGVVLVGLFWSFTLKRTGTLWFAVGMHAMFDFGETFLFSVPDSGMVFPGHLSHASIQGPVWLTGGTPGPEASVVDFLILLVFFFAFHRLYPAQREPSQHASATGSVGS